MFGLEDLLGDRGDLFEIFIEKGAYERWDEVDTFFDLTHVLIKRFKGRFPE